MPGADPAPARLTTPGQGVQRIFRVRPQARPSSHGSRNPFGRVPKPFRKGSRTRSAVPGPAPCCWRRKTSAIPSQTRGRQGRRLLSRIGRWAPKLTPFFVRGKTSSLDPHGGLRASCVWCQVQRGVRRREGLKACSWACKVLQEPGPLPKCELAPGLGRYAGGHGPPSGFSWGLPPLSAGREPPDAAGALPAMMLGGVP